MSAEGKKAPGTNVFGGVASGPPQPFFHSRWVPAPAHVRDLGPDAGLPAGFRAAGVICGIKPSGNQDLGLLVCDAEQPVSAARFTATGLPAAPVIVSQERCRLDGLRAVLANSGCANAATGGRGLDDAAKTQGATAMALGCDPAEIALASTGGISHLLPVEKMLQGILAAGPALEQGGDVAFQQAIQTTDASEKRANLEVELPSGNVRLSAQCKGAGMISPNFATMLCFVQTDAALQPETADLLLGVCVKRSFDRASVDGQLSTNDTAILMCSGASGVQVVPESEDELLFGEALDALLRQLAIMMVADGEGAERIGRVIVRGGHQPSAEAGRARRRQLAAREDCAARRRPQLGADRAGDRRRAARHRSVAGRAEHRGHPRVHRRHGDRLRRAGARRGCAGQGDRVRSWPARGGGRDRGVLLRLGPRVHPNKCRVHDMRGGVCHA